MEYGVNDESYESWMHSINGNPVLNDEYLKMQQLYQRLIKDGPSIPKPVLFGNLHQKVYGSSDYSSPTLEKMFRVAASGVRRQEASLLRRSVCRPYIDRFEEESRIRYTFNPLQLLHAAFGQNGDDPLSRQRRIRAVPIFIMSSLMLGIDQTESNIDIGDEFAAMLDQFIGQFFHKNASEVLNWAAFVEPNQLLAQEIRYAVNVQPEVGDIPEGMLLRSKKTTCRFVDGRENDLRPVILADDLKEDFAMALKIIRKGTKPKDENDMRRFTLIVMSPEDLKWVEKKFRKVVTQPPFSIKEEERIAGRSGASRANSATSEKFRVVRYILNYADPESAAEKIVPVEVNLQLLQDYANTIFSNTDVRHNRYRFKQLSRCYFPFALPRFLFGVDFREGSSDYEQMVAALP